MSGQWPPGWDDPDDVPGAADQQDAEAEAGLSEVAAYLASVPAPVMPGSVEARISAALAVESASRAGIVPSSGTVEGDGTPEANKAVKSDAAVGLRVLGPVPARAARARARARARVLERGAPGPRGRRDPRKVLGQFVLGPLAVCLLIGIIALGLSRGGSSSSSSGASVAGAPVLVPAAGASASSAPASSAASSAAAPAATSAPSAGGFVVTKSGTRYQQATLARQAHAQVLAARARESLSTQAPSASASSAPASASGASTSGGAVFDLVPGSVLRGCVLTVTGGVPPELVDRATYQGTPAYVIASASHVWVVGLGCTAARPQVIASEPLAG